MYKETRVIECTIQMQSQFWIVHWIALVFLHRGVKNDLPKIEKSKSLAANPSMLVFLIALFELSTPTKDRTNPGDFDRRATIFARVRKGGLMVETL